METHDGDNLNYNWCFRIIAPLLREDLVLAIALHSLHAHLTKLLRGRDGWVATILVIVILILMVVPAL